MRLQVRVQLVDPPSGWKFGFPKPIPMRVGSDKSKQWFIDNGYPEDLIKQGMLDHCKYHIWEIDVDV